MGSIDEEGYKGYSVINLPSKLRDKREETGLLEDVATTFILLTHSCVEKLTALPFPVGTIIEAVEELALPFVHPIEGFTLHFLAAVDDQVYAVGTTIKGYILCLRSRGLIGMSADIWVQHEAAVRERMQTIIEMANKIPLIGRITPLVCAISNPLGNVVSRWLVEHSQSKVKRIQFPETEREEGKDGLDEPKDKAADLQTLRAEIVEEAKDQKGQEITPMDTATKTGAGQATPGEEASELKAHKTTHDDKEMSAMLELIDSGWLLGSAGPASPKVIVPKMPAVASPKASASAAAPKTPATASPKTTPNPKKPANPKSRRKH